MASSSCPSSPNTWVTPSALRARVTRAPAKTEVMGAPGWAMIATAGRAGGRTPMLAAVPGARHGGPFWRDVRAEMGRVTANFQTGYVGKQTGVIIEFCHTGSSIWKKWPTVRLRAGGVGRLRRPGRTLRARHLRASGGRELDARDGRSGHGGSPRRRP